MTKPSKYFSILLLLALLGFAFSLTNFSGSHAAAAENASAVQVTKAFYQQYMKALAQDDFDRIKPDRLKAYLTPSLIARLKKMESSEEGVDADYFIKAQDYLDDWVTHIQVKEKKISQSTASAIVTLGEKEPQQLEVRLKFQNHQWRIDSVESLEP